MKLGDDTFRQLLEQIAYYDHDAGTAVVLELTEVIGHARSEGLSSNETVDLVQKRVALLTQDGMLKFNGDQYYLVLQLITELPSALADA